MVICPGNFSHVVQDWSDWCVKLGGRFSSLSKKGESIVFRAGGENWILGLSSFAISLSKVWNMPIPPPPPPLLAHHVNELTESESQLDSEGLCEVVDRSDEAVVVVQEVVVQSLGVRVAGGACTVQYSAQYCTVQLYIFLVWGLLEVPVQYSTGQWTVLYCTVVHSLGVRVAGGACTVHYIILNNGILISNSSIFPRSKGYITLYTP